MYPDVYITAALALGIVSLLLYLWKHNSNLPPGPLGLPILGYFPFLTSKPHVQYVELAKKYGSIISFRTAGGKLIVVFNGFKTVKELFLARSDEFLGRPLENSLVSWVSDGLGVAQEEGAPWKDQRRFFLLNIKHYGFGKLEIEDRIQDEIKILIDELRKTDGEPVDVSMHLSFMANSIISTILFDMKFEKEDPAFKDMCRALIDIALMFNEKNIMTVGWFFEYIVMNFFSGCRKAEAGKKILQKFIDDIIDEHIRSFDPDNLRDFVDSYLLQRQKLQKAGELEKSTFTISRLKAIALNMFFEGTESIAVALGSFLRELSKHPELQRKAQQEMDEVLGRDRMPSWLDKPNLPFVDALIMELFRGAMPFNTSTMYSNFEDMTMQGFHIPKRSILVMNLWSLGNDPQFYDNPSKFNPGRFLGPDGKRIKHDGLASPFSFGIGKRACVGESLAQMEVFLVLSCILQHFTVYPANEEASLLKLVPRETAS